ncbi:MAG: T9SS type A sorting domain-containing protein [bacterium]|nr:T9SS type A sorting domain-containing protein [bacterium]
MPRVAHVLLKVYDVLGRERGTLLDDVVQGGTNVVRWDANGFSSGVYFVRLSVGDVGVTRKVALVK